MTRATRILGRALLGSGVAALALAAPIGAAAVTFDAVYVFTQTRTDDGYAPAFGTASKTDAALAALPIGWPSEDTDTYPRAAEIVGESGFALVSGESDEGWATWLVTWVPDTGEVTGELELDQPTGVPFEPGIGGYSEIEYNGLDSLQDGTLLSTVCLGAFYENETTAGGCFLVSIGTNGSVAVLVDITDAVSTVDIAPTSLATDPMTGTTWVFFDGGSDTTAAPIVGGVVGAPVAMSGLADEFGSTFPLGADFDSTGALWIAIGVNEREEYVLMTTPAGTDLVTTAPAEVGVLSSADPLRFMWDAVLTLADPATPVGPALPGTGAAWEASAALAAGGATALVAGAIVLAAARRRAA